MGYFVIFFESKAELHVEGQGEHALDGDEGLQKLIQHESPDQDDHQAQIAKDV